MRTIHPSQGQPLPGIRVKQIEDNYRRPNNVNPTIDNTLTFNPPPPNNFGDWFEDHEPAPVYKPLTSSQTGQKQRKRIFEGRSRSRSKSPSSRQRQAETERFIVKAPINLAMQNNPTEARPRVNTQNRGLERMISEAIKEQMGQPRQQLFSPPTPQITIAPVYTVSSKPPELNNLNDNQNKTALFGTQEPTAIKTSITNPWASNTQITNPWESHTQIANQWGNNVPESSISQKVLPQFEHLGVTFNQGAPSSNPTTMELIRRVDAMQIHIEKLTKSLQQKQAKRVANEVKIQAILNAKQRQILDKETQILSQKIIIKELAEKIRMHQNHVEALKKQLERERVLQNMVQANLQNRDRNQSGPILSPSLAPDYKQRNPKHNIIHNPRPPTFNSYMGDFNPSGPVLENPSPYRNTVRDGFIYPTPVYPFEGQQSQESQRTYYSPLMMRNSQPKDTALRMQANYKSYRGVNDFHKSYPSNSTAEYLTQNIQGVLQNNINRARLPIQDSKEYRFSEAEEFDGIPI